MAGSITNNGYVYISINKKRYLAHKLAWLFVHKEWAMVDHINRIRHDNRIENLRKTTYQLNAANRNPVPNNTGFKGVYYRRGRYEVGIKINQRRIHLGVFDTLEEAHLAYIEAAETLFGEFANG